MTHSTQTRTNVSKRAVLLINLGSPDAPTPEAIARYLGEFLSDRRVVDIPKLLWQPILRGIILRTRPRKLAPRYAMIWNHEVAPENGAPLKAITFAQAHALAARLESEHVRVYWAMRYQNPAIADVLQQIAADGITNLAVLPMYPQFSYTTTQTAFDALNLAQTQVQTHTPALSITTCTEYATHPLYIQALSDSVRAHWKVQGIPNFATGDRVLLSFHGLPERNIKLGDPYQKHCEATHQALAATLDLPLTHIQIAYQSRFGKQKWIGPSTHNTLEHFAQTGCQRVDVLCPGFAADCLETLEEVAHELKDVYLAAGGQRYHYIPCLNSSPAHIELMAQLALNQFNPDDALNRSSI